MKTEISRRQNYAEQLEAFLRARPGAWIAAVDFEQFGRQAWRTRLSEVRQVIEAEGGVIENRQRRVPLGASETSYTILSEYRYRPQALGRDASDLHAAVPVPLPLYDGPPGAFQP